MDNFQQFISTTLITASDIARQNFGKVSGKTKPEDNNQVLTETDIAIGTHIIAEIEKTFPVHNIIDEEAGVIDKKSEFTWVVDPIDGTSNFANGVPTYGVMLGLLQNERPIAGGIALPAFDQMYIAEKGKGAWCNGERVFVSKESQLLRSLVAYGLDGRQHDPEFTRNEGKIVSEIVLNIRNLRTSHSAFDMAMVVAGKYGAMLEQSSRIWDNVATHILVEEAGGKYTDFQGQPIDYSDPLNKTSQNFTACFGAPTLHAELQKIIHQFA